MPSYRIVLAEDHIPFRQFIKKIVKENSELSITGQVDDGQELLEHLKGSPPDMVIVDYLLPNLRWLEATKKIKKLYPQVKVLILTVQLEREFMDQAIIYGVDGYLIKDEIDRELIPAIQAVRQGQVYISQVFLNMICRS